jgi:hypothetical protein
VIGKVSYIFDEKVFMFLKKMPYLAEKVKEQNGNGSISETVIEKTRAVESAFSPIRVFNAIPSPPQLYRRFRNSAHSLQSTGTLFGVNP